MTTLEWFEQMLQKVNPQFEANRRKAFERMDDEQRENTRQEMTKALEFHKQELEKEKSKLKKIEAQIKNASGWQKFLERFDKGQLPKLKKDVEALEVEISNREFQIETLESDFKMLILEGCKGSVHTMWLPERSDS